MVAVVVLCAIPRAGAADGAYPRLLTDAEIAAATTDLQPRAANRGRILMARRAALLRRAAALNTPAGPAELAERLRQLKARAAAAIEPAETNQ